MLENVDRIMGRMQQIEARLDSVPIDSAAFQGFMGNQATDGVKVVFGV